MMWALILLPLTVLLHSDAQLLLGSSQIKTTRVKNNRQQTRQSTFPSQEFYNFPGFSSSSNTRKTFDASPVDTNLRISFNGTGVSKQSGSSSFITGPSATVVTGPLLTAVPVLTIPFLPKMAGRAAEEFLQFEWNDFKTRYNKVYPSAVEEQLRREIFFENIAKIQRVNQEYAEKKRSFTQQINPYADMLLHEFVADLNGFNRSLKTQQRVIPQATAFIPSANVVYPTAVDWRDVGAVSDVKSQGKCAACWAFAAAGALEGHHFRKTGRLVDISAQNLIDCTEPYGNSGCSGGLMDPAFEYVRQNNGVDSEPSYPFEERNAECRFRRENVVATCTGFVDLGVGDERGIEMAVATLGPVTAAIDAGRDTFQFYGGGVYNDPDCGNRPEQMNHAVLIVGYGQEPDGQKFWMVKNSYGPEWGLGGYIKIAKDNGNQCGIAIQASYPLV
ncbi:unnamed protein product [Phaedon cochleariae]|uniref:Cathepsin L n=1 Tax=Phaedon cochleariae TaxID=80249 RepID=A0A9N9X4F1_PHACE|nr:unnamed protein product [Phaedon cochleariae]